MSQGSEFIHEVAVVNNGAAVQGIDKVQTNIGYNENSHIERHTVYSLCEENNLCIGDTVSEAERWFNVEVFSENYAVVRREGIGFRIFMERVEESAEERVESETVAN